MENITYGKIHFCSSYWNIPVKCYEYKSISNVVIKLLIQVYSNVTHSNHSWTEAVVPPLIWHKFGIGTTN